ncbi:MAG: selenocysteine-specific translation elongation factor [Thermoleophilia bacterium]|nr:selenocysteine-specific translation elongation factor [Thermoleophilia bacterium]
MPERGLTLGTAGHIDHGKTTLVRALTGKDTDRLKEEKERGISIELGYAELALPSGRHLSVVDVPGHERFVKNMVAGATGIDIFLLVVAADDGVMPQTREHLRIIELLDIPLGAVALTKTDMVDEEMVELAAADVEDFLATSRYAGAQVVPVSGTTGAGLDELERVLDGLAERAPRRAAYPATRMPIDRVFSLKGIGTVVTGTLWSGELRPEETVSILPHTNSERLNEVRVRSIQVHDHAVEAAEEGQRVALNLTGVDRQQLQRGQWVIKDPVLEPTYLADVALVLLDDAPEPLTRVSRVRVDHGTQEVLAKVVLADREELRPGESCYAQIRFEDRAVVYPGDHFILRSLTPVTTIGGGRVFDPHPHKHGTDPKWRERLNVLEEGPADAIVALLLKEAFPGGVARRHLDASPYLWRFEAPPAVKAVLADGRALEGGQQRLFHGPSLLALEERVVETLRVRAALDALDPYLSVGELRREVSGGKEWPALEAALERLQEAGDVVRTEHGLRWGQAAGALEGPDAANAEKLLAHYEAIGLEAPAVVVAGSAVGLADRDARRLVQALERQGRMTKVGEDLYFASSTLSGLMDTIAAEMEARGTITLAEVRDLFGTSRRYAQALLEHMDSEGLTLRVGDARRLRKRRR